MARLSDVARVSVDHPEPGDEVYDAWLLWNSVTTEAHRKHAETTADGYYVYRGSLLRHIRALWVTLSDDEATDLSKRLYAFLSVNNIARCVKRRDPVTWHVAMSWAVTQPRVKPVYRASRAEERVTPEEAGENMPPAKVTVAQKKKAQTDDEFMRDLTLELLKENEQPLIAEEIAYVLSGEKSRVRKLLNALESEGVLFARPETYDERRLRFGGNAYARCAKLYSLSDPVPARTKRTAVRGCTASATRSNPSSPNDVRRKLLRFMRSQRVGVQFTAAEVAEKADLVKGTVNGKLRELELNNLIVRRGAVKGYNAYVILNRKKTALLEHLGDSRPATTNGNGFAAVIEDTEDIDDMLESEPQAAGNLSSSDLETLSQVLEENTALRDRVKELEDELAVLRESANSEAVRQLRSWTPLR